MGAAKSKNLAFQRSASVDCFGFIETKASNTSMVNGKWTAFI